MLRGTFSSLFNWLPPFCTSHNNSLRWTISQCAVWLFPLAEWLLAGTIVHNGVHGGSLASVTIERTDIVPPLLLLAAPALGRSLKWAEKCNSSQYSFSMSAVYLCACVYEWWLYVRQESRRTSMKGHICPSWTISPHSKNGERKEREPRFDFRQLPTVPVVIESIHRTVRYSANGSFTISPKLARGLGHPPYTLTCIALTRQSVGQASRGGAWEGYMPTIGVNDTASPAGVPGGGGCC